MNNEVKKMYDYSEFIEILKDSYEIYKGEKYHRIICIKDFKDIYAKRTIKKGEIGGLVHYSISKIDKWIEEFEIVGAPFTETLYVKTELKERITHSNILFFSNSISEVLKFWNYKCGTRRMSLYNAYCFNSTKIAELSVEMYEIEKRYISQGKNTNGSQMILLWFLLGAILEAIVKMHIVALRHKYKDLLKNSESITKLKVNDILTKLKDDEIITNIEYIILSKINGNRNMIHFLNNEKIYGYNLYICYVDVLYEVFMRLYKYELENYDETIKLD